MIEYYWSCIPVGKENAVTYSTLCAMWGKDRRTVREILHNLSLYDNGDNYILIRSSKDGGGFYKTDDQAELIAFKKECLNKGRSNFAPVKKINRVLNAQFEDLQEALFNNLRAARIQSGLKQDEVVERLRAFKECIDVPMLSRFENGQCLPTPSMLRKMAQIYRMQPEDLIAVNDTTSLYVI